MVVEFPPVKTVHDWVEKRNRCYGDRRSGVDRRVFYRIDYFIGGGQECRSGTDRRNGIERRRSWAKDGLPCINPSTG